MLSCLGLLFFFLERCTHFAVFLQAWIDLLRNTGRYKSHIAAYRDELHALRDQNPKVSSVTQHCEYMLRQLLNEAMFWSLIDLLTFLLEEITINTSPQCSVALSQYNKSAEQFFHCLTAKITR